MEQFSAQADVSRLLEQLYDLTDKPDLNRCRDQFRELSNGISALCMVQIDPGMAMDWHGVYLTASERTIADFLHARFGRAVRKQVLHDLLYSERDESPDLKMVDVWICKLRQRFLGSKFGISTFWGDGYAMVDAKDASVPTNSGRLPWTWRIWHGIELTNEQFDVAEYFGARMGQWISSREIWEKVFPQKSYGAVCAKVSLLKARLKDEEYHMLAHYGAGYMMEKIENQV